MSKHKASNDIIVSYVAKKKKVRRHLTLSQDVHTSCLGVDMLFEEKVSDQQSPYYGLRIGYVGTDSDNESEHDEEQFQPGMTFSISDPRVYLYGYNCYMCDPVWLKLAVDAFSTFPNVITSLIRELISMDRGLAHAPGPDRSCEGCCGTHCVAVNEQGDMFPASGSQYCTYEGQIVWVGCEPRNPLCLPLALKS